MGEEYDNQFSEYCDENGFDDLSEEMGAGYEDCLLVDFDEDIPFKREPQNTEKAIFELLMKIYNNPDCDFLEYDNELVPFQIDKDDFKISQNDIRRVRQIYSAQLVTIFNGEMQDDQNILKILAISEKRNVPYLLYLTDMFSRDRLLTDVKDNRNLEPSDWVNSNKHCLQLAKLIDPKAKDIVQHAVTSFFHRIVPKLMLSAPTQINDNLAVTVSYISTQVDFVNNLARKGNKTCPFQLDALIAYNNVSMIEIMDDVELDDDEDEHDDSDDEKKTEFSDMFGNVKDKIRKENLLHQIGIIDKKDEAVSNSEREYYFTYEKFKQELKKKYSRQELEEYPRNHRFCSFIDRRKPPKYGSNNNDIISRDEIIFFEPPPNCDTIPNDARDLWYFDSSRTSVIPNIGYSKSLKDKRNQMYNINLDNINSVYGAKGSAVFISFHVINTNTIRAYLYLNGQVIRFFPEDIITILPRYFVQDKKNKDFINSYKARDIINCMKPKLRDLKFEVFYNEFANKKR